MQDVPISSDGQTGVDAGCLNIIRWTDWSTTVITQHTNWDREVEEELSIIPHNISFRLSENKYKLNAFHSPYLYLSI